MTAMQNAFETAGFPPRDNEFMKAIAKYINAGGTIERALELLSEAEKRMPGIDQNLCATNGLKHHVKPRQPVEDVRGLSKSVQKDPAVDASPSSSNRGGDGRSSGARERLGTNVLPVREPTPQQRRASLVIEKMAAVTVMDTLKIDGRVIGDWTVGEARRLGPQKTREGFILIEATRKVANARSYQLIRSVLKVEELQSIMQKAAETADAV